MGKRELDIQGEFFFWQLSVASCWLLITCQQQLTTRTFIWASGLEFIHWPAATRFARNR